MLDSEIPTAFPQDTVTASPAEVHEVQEWCAAAFTGQQPTLRGPRLELTVRRQDHSVLEFGRSCIGTPLRLGQQDFRHGLGTHAHSEIAVTVPEGATAFRALVGVDNNPDTGGKRGSVRFSIEAGGAEVWGSGILHGGSEPVAVNLALDRTTRELVLKVDATEDGPSHDQADWADAHFLLADGSQWWLDDNQLDTLVLGTAPPFAFTYGGRPSAELLPTWEHSAESEATEYGTRYTARWRDPATGLVVRAEVKSFDRTPAAEWILYFENTGAQDTPLLEDIKALDATLRSGYGRVPLLVHRLEGDACNEQSFLPATTPLGPGEKLHMAPTGGRPSSISAVPFFNLQYADKGLIVAVGWTGQWAADLDRAATGPTHLTAGMERTHLLLHPGETIRTPRLLVMPWRGDREAAHNRFRRLMLTHYAPRLNGRPARLPLASQCFDRYVSTVPEWATEAGQLAAVEATAAMGCDTHWLDAAWFPGGFPNGVGNWEAKPQEFPRGLGPIGDACHARGLRFVVWFEPERVAPGSRIAREHPEFVFGGEQGGLFRLSDPEARRWLADLLSSRIAAYGIDVYRNDFNMDPLPYWQAADAPDRQGMTEIRYVENLYALWDELLARHPGLMIDNCSSGGRRIDLETCSRSVPLWRSDTSCSPGHADWNQAQVAGLSQYVVLQTACAWTPVAYDFRSAQTGGLITQLDYRAPDFPLAQAQALVAEAKANQKYWYGDFYALTRPTTAPDHWSAYQLHRPDLDAGVVYAFRRPASPYPALALELRAVAPAGRYALELVHEDLETTGREATGQELREGMEVRLPQGESLVVRYRRIP